MKRQRSGIFLILAIAIIFTQSPGAKAAQQTPATGVKTFTLGIVFQGSKEVIEANFRDFARYVARRVSAAPDAQGRVVVAPTVWDLVKLLEKRQVDFYLESPYPTYLINRQGAGLLLLRRWKGGRPEYRSVLFARRDGGINNLEELRGKLIAFEDPGSTSGYFLPKLFLVGMAFKLAEKPTVEASVAPKEIGYVFANSVENMLNWVLAKKVAAGAFSDEDFDGLGEKKRAEIAVLGETEMFPRHFASIRKDLDPALASRLEEILLFMDQDAEGRKILQKTDNTTKFDLLPGGTDMVRRKLEALFGPH